jgi:hypothetical protein
MKYLVCGLLNFESVLVGAGWEERLFALQSLKPPLRVSQQDSILKHNLFINNGSLKKNWSGFRLISAIFCGLEQCAAQQE